MKNEIVLRKKPYIKNIYRAYEMYEHALRNKAIYVLTIFLFIYFTFYFLCFVFV